MKKIILVTLAGLLCFVLPTQAFSIQKKDSWTVRFNNKTVLSAMKENETRNSKKISAVEWKKNGNLAITYKAAVNKKDWSRSIFICDEEDNELIRKDGVTTLKISSAELKKAFEGKKKIRIFTTLTPLDPDLAARVRIRRVHLCTLEL